MARLDRAHLLEAIGAILDRRQWCLYEVCLDIPNQRWEPRTLICHDDPVEVADAVHAEIDAEPTWDARIIGCDRTTLRCDEVIEAVLCHVADDQSCTGRSTGTFRLPRPNSETR